MKMHMLLIVGLALVPLSRAGEMASRFELMQPISATLETGQIGRIKLTGDVFAQCRAFPNDVRIIDSHGTQWPYYLSVVKEQTESTEHSAEIINASFIDGTERYWQFDLLIPEIEGQTPLHNQLELVSSGSDFVRRVEVFTADEPQGHMATGYLIHFPNHWNANSNTIRYPSTDATRLHLRVYANAKNADETFAIRQAKMFHRSTIEAEREAIEFQTLEVPLREVHQNAQTLLLDTGYENRPVEFVSFDVETASFVRSVVILGRNRADEPWEQVGRGGIHRFDGGADMEIGFHARKRFLKIDIYHHDDAPLMLKTIRLEAIPRYLIFEASAPGSASLCFRAWDQKLPRYDLKSRLLKESISTASVFQTLETRPNEMVQQQPWRKYAKLFAALAVGVVALLVVWVIISMFKQQTARS